MSSFSFLPDSMAPRGTNGTCSLDLSPLTRTITGALFIFQAHLRFFCICDIIVPCTSHVFSITYHEPKDHAEVHNGLGIVVGICTFVTERI